MQIAKVEVFKNVKVSNKECSCRRVRLLTDDVQKQKNHLNKI